MSWMDSWSRPNKSSAVPPPYYITQGDNVLYCHTCGRVMSPRKSHNKPGAVVKYCSDRCRTRKPNALDRKIESVIKSLLEGEEGSGIEKTNAKSKVRKGDGRLLVTCDEIEFVVFQREADPLKTFGRRKNRYSRALGNPDDEFKSVDMMSGGESSDGDDVEALRVDASQIHADMVKISPNRIGGAKVRPPQTEAEMNFAAMGGERSKSEKILESDTDLQKRIDGQKRAEERELVRKAARRAVIFGLVVDKEQENHTSPKKGRIKEKEAEIDENEPKRRKCEAVMQGQVVEPSYAKGNWAIRWRE